MTMNLTCIDCGKTFEFTSREQEFFAVNKWDKPVRCKSCRQRHKDDAEIREAMFNNQSTKQRKSSKSGFPGSIFRG